MICFKNASGSRAVAKVMSLLVAMLLSFANKKVLARVQFNIKVKKVYISNRVFAI